MEMKSNYHNNLTKLANLLFSGIGSLNKVLLVVNKYVIARIIKFPHIKV